MNVPMFVTNFAAEQAEGIAALGVDIVPILVQTGTFVILFLLIRKFALDKIRDGLASREQTINEGLENAEKAAKAVEAGVAKQEELLIAARKDADKILADANQEAGSMLKAAEESASKKTAKMIDDAEARIESDIKAAKTALKKEVMDLVIKATEVVIEEKVDKNKDSKLLEKALSGAKK